MLADAKDNSAIVSYADGVNATMKRENESFVWSVNHYELPELEKYNELNGGIIHHSRKRSSLIQSSLREKVSKEDLSNLFSSLHPKGLCNHFYSGQFGTLWSNIYDLTERKLNVCFGAPTHNSYREYTFIFEPGISEYTAEIPDRPWSD